MRPEESVLVFGLYRKTAKLLDCAEEAVTQNVSKHTTQLVRGLSLVDTSALVVGTVIGTGVFLKAAPMAQAVGSPWLVMGAWVAAGLLSLAGALTYAELSSMMPEAGGEYVFLRKAFGEPAAFLFGWQRFIVAGSASIASLGVWVFDLPDRPHTRRADLDEAGLARV